jgi:RimJ/RimL family protein N-acetyltransferase
VGSEVRCLDPPELRGRGVVLRPLSLEHVEGVLAAADADEVFTWMLHPRPASLEEARALVAATLAERRLERRFPFVIFDAASEEIVGAISYREFDREHAHVEIAGTWISQRAWGTGKNAEAKLLLMAHAFEELGLERVVIRSDSRNERSLRAIEKLGAVREGVFRHELRRSDGTWCDSVYHSILSSEWPAAKRGILASLTAAGDRQPH